MPSFPQSCELSGQSLLSLKDGEEVVVTPSGHVCLKRLLLTKLAENGSVDPFTSSSSTPLPLQEDDLITIGAFSRSISSSSSSKKDVDMIMPPKPANASTMPNLLQLLQSEYDTLVLELFDTRKALEETRRELSQALYQNDAALRVIARLSMERDQARQQLADWNRHSGASAPPTKDTDVDATTVPPAAKKAKTTTTTTTIASPAAGEPMDTSGSSSSSNSHQIPASDHQIMMDEWKSLSAARKANKKEMANKAPKDIANWSVQRKLPLGKGITAQSSVSMRSSAGSPFLAIHHDGSSNEIRVEDTSDEGSSKSRVVTVGNDNEKTTIHTFDIHPKNASVLIGSSSSGGDAGGYLLTHENGGTKLLQLKLSSQPVAVDFHPSGKHAVVLTKENALLLIRISETTLEVIATFQHPTASATTTTTTTLYTTGRLHPDGMIYAAGTTSGDLLLWDFHKMTLAATLPPSDTSKENYFYTSMIVSPNGYHIATTTNKGQVLVWDLKKQKVVGKSDDNAANADASTAFASFDASGKHLAFATTTSSSSTAKSFSVVASVKDWAKTKTDLSLDDHNVIGLEWMHNEQLLMVASDQGTLLCYGGN